MSVKGKHISGMARCQPEVEQIRFPEHFKNQVLLLEYFQNINITYLDTYLSNFVFYRIPPKDIWKPDLLLYNRFQIMHTVYLFNFLILS